MVLLFLFLLNSWCNPTLLFFFSLCKAAARSSSRILPPLPKTGPREVAVSSPLRPTTEPCLVQRRLSATFTFPTSVRNASEVSELHRKCVWVHATQNPPDSRYTWIQCFFDVCLMLLLTPLVFISLFLCFFFWGKFWFVFRHLTAATVVSGRWRFLQD